MVLAKRKNGIYYIQYSDSAENKVRRVSTSTRNIKDAFLFLSEFQDALESKTHKPDHTLSSFRDEYIKYIGQNYSAKYLVTIESAYRHFLKYLGDVPLNEIKVIQVQRFLTDSFTRTKSGAVQFKSTLKASFNRAIDWGYLNENPFKKAKLPKLHKSYPLFISENELDKIVENTKSTELGYLFIFAFFTGMRLGEIVNLKWCDVNLATNFISIKNDETFYTKSKKDRLVPINKKIRVILQNKLNVQRKSKFVFSKRNGIKLNDSYVSKKFKDAVRISNVNEKVHFHTLRHSFASRLVQKGASIYIVKELLGHSDVTTTQIYSHLQPNNLIEVIDIL